MHVAGTFLFLPWFRLEALNAPVAWLVGAALFACAVAAIRPEWRKDALQNGVIVLVAGAVAAFAGVHIVPLQPFGLFVIGCILVGTQLAAWYASQHDIRDEILRSFAMYITFFGLIFASLLNAVFYQTADLLAFLADPFTNLRWMGLSSFGGFIGAIIGAWVWKKRARLPAWPVADAVAFAFPLAWVFGRLGCFVVHDHPGAETDFFLAVENYDHSGVARHDLGLYGAIYGAAVMLVFVLIFRTWSAERRPTGLWVVLLPLLYTPGRFLLDFLRIQDVAGADVRFGELTPAQYACVGMFFMGLVLLRQVLRQPKRPLPDRMRRSFSTTSSSGTPTESAAVIGENPAP